MKRTKVIAIVGPTSSGKSALAVHLAKEFDSEIISADSRQVYRSLNIGTGKITKREMDKIPHYLLNVASPQHTYTAARYKKQATKIIQHIVRSKKVPIVVGGTGFYFDALFGAVSLPEVPPDKLLRKRLRANTTAELVAVLTDLDPRRAGEIDKHNRHRLIRAIEIASFLGKVPRPSRGRNLYDVLWIGVTHPPKELRGRIHARLNARFQRGLIAEARKLHTQGLTYKRMRELGLEYRYLADYLQQLISKDALEQMLEVKIWQYAKRQMTWFRRNKEIHWFRPTELQKINRLVSAFLLS